MKISGVYKIENKVTGRVYIGRSVDIVKRWSVHKSTLKNNKHTIEELQEDYNNYGVDNFKYVILEECNFYKFRQKEQFWMDQYENIYNSRKVAEQVRNYNLSDEQKKVSYLKRSKAQSGSNNPRARLNISDIAYILELVELGYKQNDIADMFGVKQPTISKIVNGTRWV